MTQMLGDTITLSNEEAVTLNNLLEKVRHKEI
mgnify:FL=1